MRQPFQLPVVQAAKEDLSAHRPNQREKHVPLGIPDIALRTDKGARRLVGDHRRPPFEHFVKRADRQAGTGHQREHPLAAPQRRGAQEQLAHDHCREEALGEMAQPIVVIAGQVKRVANPTEERFAGVGVVSADDEDDGVQPDADIDEPCEWKPAAGRDEENRRNDGGGDLQDPGQPVLGTRAAPHEGGEE